ncbi:MAG TPA: hypothetical protein PLG34_00555 [Spirochaetota bacterium]|nr:MAG: hypothetical protein BWX91_00421 [Spirochaetes bacterium ADurb.Bin133]HNZ27817.1 hypothetical protein [Spirochaetota bacterium]HOF02172.1 hypothetical protein [Spirochaetota bacterium]HPY86457.1 hypothetical protein [Spirochaetota bacterium]HQH31465.1 hypothetical protein [Spirochaetota bacterium]
MKLLRKITVIKNNQISFKDLSKFNNQKVEIIIFPIKEAKENIFNNKDELLKYSNSFKSGFSDTSTNVDDLIYES